MEDIVIPDEADEVPPTVTLTDEEKKTYFVKHMVPDLAPHVLAAAFAGFTLPVKDEGFDQVRFDWLQEAKAAKHVNEWILSRKITTRIEDIQPSEWFKLQWGNWQAQLHRWHSKLNDWKDPAKKKPVVEAAEGATEEQEVATEEKKKRREESRG